MEWALLLHERLPVSIAIIFNGNNIQSFGDFGIEAYALVMVMTLQYDVFLHHNNTS